MTIDIASQFDPEHIQIDNLPTGTMVSITKNISGDLVFSRKGHSDLVVPRTTEDGITVVSATLNGSNEIIVTLSEGEPINLGVAATSAGYVGAIGNGYLKSVLDHNPTFIPIVATGNAQLITTPQTITVGLLGGGGSTAGLNYNNLTQMSELQIGTASTTITAATWITRTITRKTIDNLDISVAASGHPILPAGTYHVTGFLGWISAGVSVFRFYNVTTDTVLGYLHLSINTGSTTRRFCEYFSTTIVLPVEAEIVVQQYSSAIGYNGILGYSFAPICRLNYYKV